MFEHFNFSKKQIDKYYNSAKRDFKIALDSNSIKLEIIS